MSGYFDANTTNGNFTLWNTPTASTSDMTFSFSGNTAFFTTDSNWCVVTTDKDWMPYRYVEYEPRWHKKFARYKIQMKNMWN